MDIDALREAVRLRLDDKRFLHTLGCEETAARLAAVYGADEIQARQAALLHDITKCLELREQLKLCGEWSIIIDDSSKSTPALLHAITGAEAARREFGMDEAVCTAIRFHTTGRAGMSILEEIIYLADAIEPNRSYPGVERLRDLAYSGIRRAMAEALAQTIILLAGRGLFIYPESIYVYNEYITMR